MSEAEIFTLALIDAVKKRPILYDTSDASGGNKNTLEKNTAWSDIATELGENVRTIKTRWKGLKECYVKCKKSRSEKFCNHTSYDQYRNWRWASYLEFMEPHLKGLRNIDDSVQYVEEYEYEEESFKEDNETNIFDDCASNNETPSDTASPKGSPKVNIPQINSVEPADDIHYLFLSYAETLRKFPPKKQILIKLEMAKLFSKAEMESLEDKDPFSST